MGWRCLGMLLLLLLIGEPVLAGNAFPVAVSIPPQKWLVRQVGGEHVTIQMLISSGQDPHTFEPTPAQVAELARAQVYFTIGLAFEKSLLTRLRRALPHLDVVDMAAGLSADSGDVATGHLYEDPHVWLSPDNLAVMARQVAVTLSRHDPAHRQVYQNNLQYILGVLEQTREVIKRQLAPCKGRNMYVFHPAFGAFARTFGLHQRAIETGGRSPAPRQLALLIRQMKQEGVRVIFVQPQFDRHSAAAIATAISARLVVLDPLAEDVVANLKTMAGRIAASLACGTR